MNLERDRLEAAQRTLASGARGHKVGWVRTSIGAMTTFRFGPYVITQYFSRVRGAKVERFLATYLMDEEVEQVREAVGSLRAAQLLVREHAQSLVLRRAIAAEGLKELVEKPGAFPMLQGEEK